MNPIQRQIRTDLGIATSVTASDEAERRIQWIMNYARTSKVRSLVLGISGGIDSTTAGLMAQEACRRLRAEGINIKFIAVRLPYRVQRDEEEAQAALAAIRPDEVVTINIEAATDGMMSAIYGTLPATLNAEQDFTKGNIKARQRMIAQYALAGATGGIVIGTDHGAEALMGFFTKFGDGACDIAPLTGLTKRRVRAIGGHLGAPANLVNKVPTADLEDLDPGKPDEKAYGVTYDEIDDFLEGKNIAPESEEKILAQYRKTAHKRVLPMTPV